MSKFKSGFAWIKVNGYSYICKILREYNGLYEVEIGDYCFFDVPENELAPVYGDEEGGQNEQRNI